MTKLPFLKKVFFLFLLIYLGKPGLSYSQCVGCTKTYTANTAANVTVAVGQTVCINAGVTMSGQIFLNGGVLCNNGIVNNLRLNNGRGRVNNYNIAKNIESSITFTGNVSIYSYANSQITFTTVTINMNNADSLFFNVYNGGRVTFPSDLSISSKKLSIVNGVINPGAPGNVSQTLFNIGANLSINNATLSLINKSTGRLNVSGSVNLSNGGKRTIINQGIFNIYNALNISGAAVGPTLIDNSNNLSITNSFSCTATSANGTFIFSNANTSPGITVGQDLVLSILNCTTTNNGILNVNGNINYTKGSFTNGNTLSCVNFSIPGTATPFVNNGKSTITNLTISGTGKLTNNSLLDISQGFTNSGTGRVVFGTQSLLKTLNYSNSSTDSIIGAPNTVTDTLNFARIYIIGSSTNSGAISKKVMIFDESLTHTASNIGYGFDVVTNPSKIDLNGVKFVKTTVAPGTSGVFNTLLQKKYFAISVKADNYTVPCGSEEYATLTAAFGPLYYSPLFGFNYIYSLPSIAYNWSDNPGGLTGPVKAYLILAPTTYSVNVLNNGITYWATAKINVSGIVATIPGAPNIYFVKPNVVNLSAINVSGGGPPYTYQWTPNSFFVNGTNQNQLNAQVSPTTSITYSLSIRDFAFGCTTIFTVNLIDASTNAQIIKRHVAYNNPINGSAFISLLGGILPHKVLWKNNLNSNYRSDLVPGGTYNVRILATPTSTDTIRKQIRIGTQYSWKFKTNLTFLSEVAKRNRTDSLGLCIAENKVAKNIAGWTEIKVNKLSNDVTIGFCGDNNDVFLESAAYQQSFRTNNTNMSYSLMAMAVNNTLPYSSNTLNVSPTYTSINMVRIKDGVITLLFRGSSNVTTYPCAVNDVVKIGRTAGGNMYLAVNESILYTHNVNVNSQFLYPVFTANSDNQLLSANSGSGLQDVYIDPATVVPDIYAVPKVKLDGGYYTTVANKLLFKVEGEYNATTIKFIVYDKTNANVLSDNNVSAIIPFFYQLGDNRYALDVSSLTTAGYYILEVINEKNEKLYLRFKHTNSGINPNPDPIDNTDTGGSPPSN